MRLEVKMQDPTHADTTYLYEAILSTAQTASSWRGFYAFATRDGVDQLIDDNVVHDLMTRGGRVDLVVGLDAITNRPTLERMQELARRHPNFTPRVFWNQTRALFHPKISDFDLANGGRVLIVGSGNLTPGGLRTNFEAYTVVTAEPDEEIDVSSLTDFALRHADRITPINAEALDRAEANRARPIGSKRTPPSPSSPDPAVGPGFGRVMLAQVPKAGGRWGQVHFNAEVIRTFFNLRRIGSERIYLTRVLPDENRDLGEVRPCVYSETNKNYKIEVGAARGLQYPADNRRPLIVFLERQLRSYDYLLLMPGHAGYERLLNLSNNLPSPGRGLPRPLTDIPTLSHAWPDCPLLQAATEDHQVV